MALTKRVADERGTTLVELMVGMAAGLVVLTTLTMVIVVTLHGSARVSARVDATQRARLVVGRIIDELHSACVAPKVAPIYPESSGTTLRFIHATGSEGGTVAPTPTLTEIVYSEGKLLQYDYAALPGGTAPGWGFSETATPPAPRVLMTNVAPIAPSTSIFSYYTYSNGALSATPQVTPLVGTTAALTISVAIALTASPGTTPVADKGAAASVQDSAVLRLTPPSFNEQAVALPCQ